MFDIDFDPKFECLDELKIGDEITIYHANKTSFQKNKDKYGGYFYGAIGFLMAIILLTLKQVGKIE